MNLSELSIRSARLRDGHEPAARRARRDRLHAPDAARAARDRSARSCRSKSTIPAPRPPSSRRASPRSSRTRSPASRASRRSTRGAANGEGSISIEFSLVARHRGGRQRRARRGEPRAGPHAAGGRPAGDREGGVGFRGHPLAQHALDADGHARAHRLRLPLRARPALGDRRRGAGADRRRSSATRCASGSTAPRSPRAG